MTVDFSSCTVFWAVDGQVRYSQNYPLLKDRSIKWVQWMCMWANGDSVSLDA